MSTAADTLYETDFYAWLQQQARAIRTRNFAHLDWDNLVEEIEDMGKNHQRALQSRLEVLLMHLLKWQFQPERQSRSWSFTIKEQRLRLTELLSLNPSLKSKIADAQIKAYRYALFAAAEETGLDRAGFPAECPWTFEQIMDEQFWPTAEKQTST